MERPKICLTLTGKTLDEDIEILNKYRNYVDMCELRADYLVEDDWFNIRSFPARAEMPCILTIRRKIDGGNYTDGEAARATLFAHALAFANLDKKKNFEYVDFEEDFHISSLEDAALAFGIKIIRSVHNMKDPIHNICERLKQIQKNEYEIPKIAFMPHSLKDVQNLFEEAEKLSDNNHILIAMGPMGTISRILAYKLKNFLTFCSPTDKSVQKTLSQLDPKDLNDIYHIRELNDRTKLYGIAGWPLDHTSSPELHNKGYENHKMNAVYVPIRSPNFDEIMDFAKYLKVKGLSVTIPHKEAVLNYSKNKSAEVESIGASNTMVVNKDSWDCYNTDYSGFTKSLLEWTGLKSLRFKKVAIIGAGGAAKGIAYAVKKLHGKACVFNRTLTKARDLASQYGFKYAPLSFDSQKILEKYSDIIIQTTSKGMGAISPSNDDNDPIYYYDFDGHEYLFDIIYAPEVTPVMERAAKAGCKVINGFDMLKYQGYEQFKLFTDEEYNSTEKDNEKK